MKTINVSKNAVPAQVKVPFKVSKVEMPEKVVNVKIIESKEPERVIPVLIRPTNSLRSDVTKMGRK